MGTVHDNIRNWNESFEKVANDLGVEAAALHAVAAAEVGSLAPPPVGLPVIRFEVHMFLKESSVDVSSRIELRDAPTAWHKDAHWYKNDPDSAWERVHSGSQADEWGALATAAGFDPTPAFRCTSWGVGQLMGWHHKTCGFATVQGMVAAAMKGPRKQFAMWGTFFVQKNGGQLVEAMRAHDWRGFARVYNGPGQVDYYGAALDKHYNTAKGALAGGLDEERYKQETFGTWTERQTALRQLGYAVGPIDGQPGPTTRAALKQFQADQGLTPDGVWGAKTDRAVTTRLA